MSSMRSLVAGKISLVLVVVVVVVVLTGLVLSILRWFESVGTSALAEVAASPRQGGFEKRNCCPNSDSSVNLFSPSDARATTPELCQSPSLGPCLLPPFLSGWLHSEPDEALPKSGCMKPATASVRWCGYPQQSPLLSLPVFTPLVTRGGMDAIESKPLRRSYQKQGITVRPANSHAASRLLPLFGLLSRLAT
jgi:hypothetical protein